MNELLRKLKESGLILDSDLIKPNRYKKPESRLEEVFHGYWDRRDSGEVFIINEFVPYGDEYANLIFSKNINPSAYLSFETNLSSKIATIKNIAFFDIETSSLSFGAGSFVFLIGFSHFSDYGLETSLLLIDHPSAEKALLERFNKDIETFEIICSYNGKSFDVPFIRKRYALHHVDDIIETKYHIDLLFYARRLWKLRIDSCKLSHVEEIILNLKRGNVEIPGWMVPQVYFDFLNEQDPFLLEGIIYHNKIDVISLAALYQHIAHLLTRSTGNDQLDSRDCFSLARLHESNGEYAEANYYYKLGLHSNCDEEIAHRYYWNYGMFLKRNGELTEAVHYWKKSAAVGGLQACIELSKYYEHKNKDYNQALKWAVEAMNIINLINDGFDDTNQKSQLAHRIDRITRKLINNEK